MNIVPSRWNWLMFKNILHMHCFIQWVPLGVLIAYVNVTLGPASLKPTPEGYVPSEEEYHRHPIQRYSFSRNGPGKYWDSYL
jgi:hypothetical protein